MAGVTNRSNVTWRNRWGTMRQTCSVSRRKRYIRRIPTASWNVLNLAGGLKAEFPAPVLRLGL